VWFVLTKLNEKNRICETSLSVICTEQHLLPCRKNNALNIVQMSKVIRKMEGGVNRYGIDEKLRRLSEFAAKTKSRVNELVIASEGKQSFSLYMA
jgi:hypothetical protein